MKGIASSTPVATQPSYHLKPTQAAFRDAKDELSDRFLPGHFVAFDDGRAVADASTFDQLTAALITLGKDAPDVFVVQTSTDYPDEVFILP